MKKGWLIAAGAAVMLTTAGCGAEESVSVATTRAAQQTQADHAQGVKGQADKLKANMDQAEQERNAKSVARDAKSAEFSSAEKAYQEAKAAQEDFEQKKSEILPLIGKGTLGFFMYVNAEDAVEVLQNAKYASDTKIGAQGDATALESMMQAFSPLKSCNDLRVRDDRGALMVTDRMMAIAQSDVNWIDGHLEKPEQFETDEIFICGYDNPYQIWFDEEEAYEGENYLTMMNPDYTVTGFAYCNANRSGQYKCSHCQVFGNSNGEQTFTIEEYEERYTAYFDMMIEAESEYSKYLDKASAAKTTMEKMKAEYDAAQDAYDKAEEAYQQAKRVYEWYT